MRMIAIAGQMYAGKDTVADLVAAQIANPARVTFSDLICAEASPAVQALRIAAEEHTSRADTNRLIRQALRLNEDEADQFIDLLKEDVSDPQFTIRHRTDGSRAVLQALGSSWRPDGYWAHKVHRHCLFLRRRGNTVILVGCRYPAEHELFAGSGALMVRLLVSPEEQVRRALARDGKKPDPAAVNHPGERAVAHLPFDLVLDSDVLSPDQSAAKILESWA